MNSDSRSWTELSEAFAFLGNSLLAPMSQTERHGIGLVFWQVFPDFGNEEVAEAIAGCRDFAAAKREELEENDLVREISVEYTNLFVGPPRPAAAPWETFYRNDGISVGFGEATFEMRRLLREEGLQVSNENNQYADHIGIELLYLSVLCKHASRGGKAEADACASFAAAYPLSWVSKLQGRVFEEAPEGYYRLLLKLTESLLRVVAR